MFLNDSRNELSFLTELRFMVEQPIGDGVASSGNAQTKKSPQSSPEQKAAYKLVSTSTGLRSPNPS